jgi:integrase
MQKMDQMMDIEILSAGARGSCTADATTSRSRDAMGSAANGELGKALSPGDVDGFAALVARYLEHRAIQNYSPATIATERWVLRQLSAWCCRCEICRPVDVTRPVMEAWQRAVFEHRTAKVGLRDRAILETLYSTGIRRAELAAVNVIDVGFDEGMVAARKGKGRKGRVVPIGDRALSWIEKYLLDARPLLLFGLPTRGPDRSLPQRPRRTKPGDIAALMR